MSQVTSSVTARPKAAAPGQYLGYALQPVRLCFHLLSADDNLTASVEHLEDVAVRKCDDSLLLEQTKSALKQNPVSDWSNDLWKTFANWIDNIECGLVDPQMTRFQLYVTPTRAGYWVDRLSNTNFPSDVQGAINDLKADVEGRKPRPRCYRFLKRLLDADRDLATALIVNFRLVSDEDPIEPLRRILKLGVQDELLDATCAHAIGLGKKSVDELIRKGWPAIVDSEDFKKKLRAFISKHNLSRLLPSFATEPDDLLIERTLDDRPMFVKQLDVIGMEHYDIVRAISDFLQSASDKTDWADKGIVVEQSLWEFDESLLRIHRLKKIEIDDIHQDLAKQRKGRILYSRCVTTTADLEGREVPSHFVPGCYNGLADRLELGWHPDFDSIFRQGDE